MWPKHATPDEGRITQDRWNVNWSPIFVQASRKVCASLKVPWPPPSDIKVPESLWVRITVTIPFFVQRMEQLPENGTSVSPSTKCTSIIQMHIGLVCSLLHAWWNLIIVLLWAVSHAFWHVLVLPHAIAFLPRTWPQGNCTIRTHEYVWCTWMHMVI